MAARPAPYPHFDGTQPCVEMPDVWMLAYDTTDYQRAVLRATCDRCPFEVGCREYAVTHDEHGFWGGLTERERAAERRERHIRPAQAEAVVWYSPSRQARILRKRRQGEP